MTEQVENRCPTELGGILCRVFGIRRVIDTPLLRKAYYAGLALLATWAVAGILEAVNLAIDHPGGGVEGFFFVSAIVGVGTVGWRLVCELALGILLILPS